MIAEVFRNPGPGQCGVRVGDVLAGQGITGADGSGRLASGLRAQAETALENLRACVTAAGGDLSRVARVTLLMRDTSLLAEVNRAWVTMFPDAADRPTYKFIPAPLPPEELLQIEFIAVMNGRREVLNLPVVAHANPIPMGVRIGEYLFSSRVLPMDPATGRTGDTTEEQARFVFENAAQLLELGGMDWTHMTQGRVFAAGDPGFQLMNSGWRERAARVPAPVLHQTGYQAGRLAVMLEFIAWSGSDAQQ